MYCRRSPQSFVLGARDVLKVLKKPVLPVGKVELCTLILFSTVVIQSNVRDNKKSLLYCSPFKFNLIIHGDIEKNPGPESPTSLIPTTTTSVSVSVPSRGSRKPRTRKRTLATRGESFISPEDKKATLEEPTEQVEEQLEEQPEVFTPTYKPITEDMGNYQPEPLFSYDSIGSVVVVLDIETFCKEESMYDDSFNQENNRFPGSDPIVIIGCSICVPRRNRFDLQQRHVFYVEGLPSINRMIHSTTEQGKIWRSRNPVVPSESVIHPFPNEQTMLKHFMDWLYKVRPLAIFGYYSNSFDIPAITFRYELLVEPLTARTYPELISSRTGWSRKSFKCATAIQTLVDGIPQSHNVPLTSTITEDLSGKVALKREGNHQKRKKKAPKMQRVVLFPGIPCVDMFLFVKKYYNFGGKAGGYSLYNVTKSILASRRTFFEDGDVSKEEELAENFKAFDLSINHEKLELIKNSYHKINQINMSYLDLKEGRFELLQYCLADTDLVRHLVAHHLRPEMERLLFKPTYKTFKHGLFNLLLHKEKFSIVYDMVSRTNRIVKLGLFLLKLYYLNEFFLDSTVTVPSVRTLTQKFISQIFWVVSEYRQWVKLCRLDEQNGFSSMGSGEGEFLPLTSGKMCDASSIRERKLLSMLFAK
ncbi:hypothetical protein RCL1_009068 [Eukaryota sp. TZLM3-RCL]